MPTKVFSRDGAQDKAKKLQRIKQPLAIKLTVTPPRNPVVFAMAHRAASSGAGKHIRAQGATRRAEKVNLQKLARQSEP
jgi:hypothetical protein